MEALGQERDRSGTGAGAGCTEQSVNVRSMVLSVLCRGWGLGVMVLLSIKKLYTKSLHSSVVRWKRWDGQVVSQAEAIEAGGEGLC